MDIHTKLDAALEHIRETAQEHQASFERTNAKIVRLMAVRDAVLQHCWFPLDVVPTPSEWAEICRLAKDACEAKED